MKIISYISNLFWENKCFWCQKSGHFFCLQCNAGIEIYKPYCYVCKKYSHDFSVHKECQTHFPIDQVIVLTRYRNPSVKKLLRHAKYYNKYKAYNHIISQNLDFFRKYVDTKNSVFIPVPMHFLRIWKRGYNQSERIAQNLWNICQIPVENSFLKKIKHTKQQSHLSKIDRAKNLSWVFSLRNNIVDKNSTIYLIDDIISTGSTVLEIANLLHKNGYKNIRVIGLASD